MSLTQMLPRSYPLRVSAIALAIFLFPLTATATSVVALDLPLLTKASNTVVYGEVVKQESKWDAQKRTISTFSTLRIESSVKGGGEQEVIIEQPGGTVNDDAQRVLGAVLLQPNEKVLLFLENHSNSSNYKITGFGQGMYRVQEQGGNQVAHPVQAHGLELFKWSANGKLTKTASDLSAMPLDKLVETIRALDR